MYASRGQPEGETGRERATATMSDGTSDVTVMAEARLRTFPAVWRRQMNGPWDTDEVLLNLSIWWVKMTCSDRADFTAEVAAVFASLRHDLR